MLENIKIGADPELFGFNTALQEFVSVHKFFPGTKEKPFPCVGGALQLDGVAAEINVIPSSTKGAFINNIDIVMRQARERMPKHIELRPTPTATFNQGYFDQLQEDLKLLGCDPDFNAWKEGAPNPTPTIDEPIRVAGGHVHIGWTKDVPLDDKGHQALCQAIAKQLDCTLGVSALMWDDDDTRRTLYGKAGAHRVKSYGVEYRTPSNKWLESKALTGAVYDMVMFAIQKFNSGQYLFIGNEDMVPYIINEGDRELAQEFIDNVV